jgi:hypothetical protein
MIESEQKRLQALKNKKPGTQVRNNSTSVEDMLYNASLSKEEYIEMVAYLAQTSKYEIELTQEQCKLLWEAHTG